MDEALLIMVYQAFCLLWRLSLDTTYLCFDIVDCDCLTNTWKHNPDLELRSPSTPLMNEKLYIYILYIYIIMLLCVRSGS